MNITMLGIGDTFRSVEQTLFLLECQITNTNIWVQITVKNNEDSDADLANPEIRSNGKLFLQNGGTGE